MAPDIRRDFLRICLRAVLAVLIVPCVTLIFTEYAGATYGEEVLAALEQSIGNDAELDAADKTRWLSAVRETRPLAVCRAFAPAQADESQSVCARYGVLWQFYWVDMVARVALAAGLCVLLLVSVLGALAFARPALRYLSFMFGWRLLSVGCAVLIVIHGAMLVWLSYWLTAYFGHFYAVRLIAVATLVALACIFYAVRSLFLRPPGGFSVDGVEIGEAQAPALWAHVRELAGRLGTDPPGHIVAGIDCNFFVTQMPTALGTRVLRGRILYVSLPLLGVMTRDEADAVLAHELAHFQGGDAAQGAALAPLIARYDQYCSGAVGPSTSLLLMYRMVFELALQRDNREREFRADGVAAAVISSEALARALIRIAAYTAYRGEMEQALLVQRLPFLNGLGIAERIGQGWADYACSGRFVSELRSVPHPFDSHPSLTERMRRVGHLVEERAFSQVAAAPVEQSWVDAIDDHAAIERAQWAGYEDVFRAEHEEQLAYHYLPSSDDERALVEKFFPPLSFALPGGKVLGVTYAGPILPDTDVPLGWDQINKIRYEKGFWRDRLILEVEEVQGGHRQRVLRLKGFKPQRAAFNTAMVAYWHRHQVMRGEVPAA